jgi:hypothetical protein
MLSQLTGTWKPIGSAEHTLPEIRFLAVTLSNWRTWIKKSKTQSGREMIWLKSMLVTVARPIQRAMQAEGHSSLMLWGLVNYAMATLPIMNLYSNDGHVSRR